MKAFLTLLRENSFFYKVSVLITIVCCLFLCFFTKADGFILLNSVHTDSLNRFFQNITFFGDGLFSLLIIAVLLAFFKEYREFAFLSLIAYLLSGLFSQLLKNCITSPRPSAYFESHHYLFYIDTFKNCRVGFSSFPSGHTATVFAMATITSIYFKNKWVSIGALFGCLLVGYSRIYLAHHFLMDVLGGILIGILFGSLSVLLFDEINLRRDKRIRRSYSELDDFDNFFPNYPTMI